MYASGRTDNISGLSIIHLPDGVRERTRCVDHAFGFHLKLLSGEFVPKRVKMNAGNMMDTKQQATGWIPDASRIPATSTTHFPRTVFQQGEHSRVVGNGGTKPCCRDGDADVHPGIVVHPVVIHDRPTQLVLLQHWELLQGSAFGQHIGGLETVSTGDEIVSLDARPEVGQLPPAVDGQHDRQREGEMGRDVQEVGSLVQRLLHHLVLLVVEAHDRLLQVADASVNKFCAATARPAAEVVELHHGRLQTAGRAVQGTIEMLTKIVV